MGNSNLSLTFLFRPVRFSLGESLEPVGRMVDVVKRGATSSDILDCVTFNS